MQIFYAKENGYLQQILKNYQSLNKKKYNIKQKTVNQQQNYINQKQKIKQNFINFRIIALVIIVKTELPLLKKKFVCPLKQSNKI